MKWFWILIGLLALGVTGIAIWGPDSSVHALDSPPQRTPEANAPPSPSPPEATPPPSRSPGDVDLPGAGGPADPYRVSWPLLMSAQVGSDANSAQNIPLSIKSLDGAWIEISGYLAPPIAAERTRELLVMRNRWDGCCIGTPPTPFDCIEVKLTDEVVIRGKHLIQFGSVRGVLRVEPFVAGGFLLGLYRIEQGQVDGFGG